MNRMCWTFRLSFVLVAKFVMNTAPSLVWAQTQNASIIGVLTDQSGSILPNVTVRVTSPALQVPSLTAITDSQGAYRFADLPAPGVYRITFEAKGFRTTVNDGINLGVGFTAKIDGALSVGSVTDKVEVTTASPVVDTLSTASSSTLQQQEIQDAPKGLGLTELLPMAAGVSYQGKPDVGDSNLATTTTAVTFGAVLQPTLEVEGINLLTGKSSDSHIYLQATALAEVEFKTSGNNADVGLPGVAQVAVMKSGGNTFHGDLQVDYQPPTFQGNNITPALAAPPNNLTVGNPLEGPGYYDYSGDIGGRIITNKLCFYGGYAGQYLKEGQVNFVAAPDAAGCWTYVDSVPGNVITSLSPDNSRSLRREKPLLLQTC
jgi:hypothetical protein